MVIAMGQKRKLIMKSQPDYTSCGPTSLEAIYSYLGDEVELTSIIKEIKQFEDGGGTLAVILGRHALKRGYEVTLYSYNINIFDPTWFNLENSEMKERLYKRLDKKENSDKEKQVIKEYISFLDEGGELCFEDLSPYLIKDILLQDIPILTGLSATWLYRTPRENPLTSEDDADFGEPSGHFVVLYGLESSERVLVADPYRLNPISRTNYYEVEMNRLINSILLGVASYDGNLLLIKGKKCRT